MNARNGLLASFELCIVSSSCSTSLDIKKWGIFPNWGDDLLTRSNSKKCIFWLQKTHFLKSTRRYRAESTRKRFSIEFSPFRLIITLKFATNSSHESFKRQNQLGMNFRIFAYCLQNRISLDPLGRFLRAETIKMWLLSKLEHIEVPWFRCGL